MGINSSCTGLPRAKKKRARGVGGARAARVWEPKRGFNDPRLGNDGSWSVVAARVAAGDVIAVSIAANAAASAKESCKVL